jgi:outer membrane protein assembly factor BamB
MMVKYWLRGIGVAVVLGLLSACSNGPSLPTPTKLQKISATQTITEHWQVQVGSGAKQHALPLQPVLLAGVVYGVSASGEVSAIDALSGQSLWRVDLQQPISAGLGYLQDKLLVATANGELHMLQASDGATVWSTPTSSEVLAVPQSASDMVLVQAIDGRITAYAADDAAVLWSYASDLPSLTLRGTSTPVVDGGVSYAGFANGKLLAIDNKQGKVVWQQRISAPKGRSDMERLVDIDGPLQLVEGTLYVAGYQGNLAAVEAISGRVIWQQAVSSYTAPSIYGDQVFVVTDKGTVMAFDRQHGTEMWRNDDFLHRGLSRVVASTDAVMVLDSLGYVHLLEPNTGMAIGRYKLGHNGAGAGFVRHGADVYVLGQDASLSRLSLN